MSNTPIATFKKQSLWEQITADTGSVTASSPIDSLAMAGGAGITTSITGSTVTITNDNPNVDQNIWQTITADTGSTTADTTTDTFNILGGTGISTAIVGDTITLTNDSPNIDQNLWATFTADTGSTTANITTDTLTISGGTNVTTTISGDTLTIDATDVVGDAFTTIATPAGTSPAADNPTDTLTFTTAGGLTITGDSATDTIAFDASGIANQNLFQTFAVPAGTNPVADSTTDTITFTTTGGIVITGDASTDTINFDTSGIANQNLWETITADTGSTAANTTTDTLTTAGGEAIDTSITGDTLTISAEDANETNKGVAEIATQTETNTGTDDEKIITPLKLAGYLSTLQSSIKLATVNSIDAKVVGNTILYTVPAGKTAIITNIVIRPSTITGGGSEPKVQAGTNATTYDNIIDNTNLAGLTSTNDFFRINTIGVTAKALATEVIRLRVTNASSMTTYTISVDLFGYLV